MATSSSPTRSRLLASLVGCLGAFFVLSVLAVLLWKPYKEDTFKTKALRPPQRPLTELAIKSAQEATELIQPTELVVGVTIGNDSRAYPVNMLCGPEHEIVNDRLGGKAIAVTWCPLCHSAIVYDRSLDSEELLLAVSGQLWQENLVMYDVGTVSLWSHALGEAMEGPLRGRRLAQIPSVLTDWQTWQSRHPATTVIEIKRISTAYHRSFYKELAQYVLGISNGREAKAWTLARLNKEPVWNDLWLDQPVVVLFDSSSVTARLYSRYLQGKTLHFRREGNLVKDQETGSIWDPITGLALAGPLKDRQLEAMPASIAFWEAWLRFHPRSEFDTKPL